MDATTDAHAQGNDADRDRARQPGTHLVDSERRDASTHGGPGARGATRSRAAPERGQSVGDPLQPGAARGGVGVEPAAVVDRPRTRACRPSARVGSWPPTPPRTWRRSGAPRGSRSRRPPRSPAGSARPRRSRPMTGTAASVPGLSSAAREPLVGEQRRIDAAREVPEVLQRLVVSVWSSASIACVLPRPFADQRVGEPQLDRQRDELLLRAVVDVPLEPCGAPRPAPRRAAAATPGGPRSRPTFRRTRPACAARSATSCSFVGSSGFGRTVIRPERSEVLALVTYGEGPSIRSGSCRSSAAPGRPRCVGDGLGRPSHDRRLRPGRLGEHPRHPGQHVLDGVRLRRGVRRTRRAPRTASPARRRRAGRRRAAPAVGRGWNATRRRGRRDGGEEHVPAGARPAVADPRRTPRRPT